MKNQKSGIVLVSVVVLLMITSMLAGGLMHFSQTGVRMARRWHLYDQCLLAAQSGLEQSKFEAYNVFSGYFYGPVGRQSWTCLNDWFSESTPGYIGMPSDRYQFVTNMVYHDALVTITLVQATNVVQFTPSNANLFADMVLRSTAVSMTDTSITRTVEERVRLALIQSPIFDYAYFINNWGWLFGNTIRMNGDVRANGNFTPKNCTINGDMFAAYNDEAGAEGIIDESSGVALHQNENNYRNSINELNAPIRPTNPADIADSIPWPMGYDDNVQYHEYQEQLIMPYLGDLDQYELFASNMNGRIISIDSDGNEEVLVDAVYTGEGPDGIADNADDGTLILTSGVNQIVIQGPVVIHGDVLVKGTNFTGQGTVYAGRNLHVMGTLTTANPPVWPTKIGDSDPEATMTDNINADLIGFACKGNVVFGSYDCWHNIMWYYLKSVDNGGCVPHYRVDESDDALGYVSYMSTNGPMFDGNYTGLDGGQRLDNDGNEIGRHFYEPSVSDNVWTSLNEFVQNGSTPMQIDAILYNNHCNLGFFNKLTLNGCMVGRDDAMVYSGYARWNWDIRLGSRSRELTKNYFLPLSLVRYPITIAWREVDE